MKPAAAITLATMAWFLATSAGCGGASDSAPANSGPLIGTNIHEGGQNGPINQQIADAMAERHLRTARMDYLFQGAQLTVVRDQIVRLAAKGIQVEVSTQIPYQWDHTCSQDLAAVQSTAYAQTTSMVQAMEDLVHDFELLNEVSLRPEIQAEVPPSTGQLASAYEGKPCAATLAAALKGMSLAISDRRSASGKPLRVILGAVGRDFGILDFLQQKGVKFDVVGYHAYPSQINPPLDVDEWYGPGGAIGQLAKYNKPVRINEFNCGEIYRADYENTAGMPVTNTCLASIQKHLSALLSQQVINLESISTYELRDSSNATAPENHFGLMYDIDHPKLHLALYAAFAGGLVTPTEKQQLEALKLKSQ